MSDTDTDTQDTLIQVGTGLAKATRRRTILTPRKSPAKRTREHKTHTGVVSLKRHIETICYSQIGWKVRFISQVLSQVPEYMWRDVWYDQAYRDEEILKSLAQEHIVKPASSLHDLTKDMRLKYRLKFAKLITPLQHTSYDLTHLMDIIIECALGEYKRLCKPGAKHMYTQHSLDTWEPETALQDIQVLNLSANVHHQDAERLMTSALAPFNAPRLLFHCTNWDGAQSICTMGPKYAQGRKCLDFGSSPSFYVTPDIRDVIDWGRKSHSRWHNEIACVVFSDNDIRQNIPTNKLQVFDTPDKTWQELTTQSRRCVYNTLDKMQLVYGPMVANSIEVKLGIDTSRSHKHVKYQVASKSDATDEMLKSRILGVVYFARSRH